MQEVPISCRFLALLPVRDKALAIVIGSRYFVPVFKGSEAFVVTGRDTDATRAKAEDATGAADWIWLREALVLAVAALGSEALAKRRLREWLASAKVPWDCKEWEGPDAAAMATLKRKREEKSIFSPVPPPAWTGFVLSDIPEVPYAKGDPRFWEVADADWDDNTARDPATGARAWGIAVSRARLVALLSPPTNADAPAPEAPLEAASEKPPEEPPTAASSSPPGPPKRNVSASELEDCIRAIKAERPNDPPREPALWKEVESRLGAKVSREQLQLARDAVAPGWKLPQGRPRKRAQ
jgi:hypothetical protein